MGFWIKVVKKEPRAKRVSTAYPFYPFTRFMHRLQYTSDYDPKNALDIEKFLNRKEKIHPDDTFVMVDADSLPSA